MSFWRVGRTKIASVTSLLSGLPSIFARKRGRDEAVSTNAVRRQPPEKEKKGRAPKQTLQLRVPVAIALALAAPLAGWFAMGPALLFSVETPASANTADPQDTHAPPSQNGPQRAIMAASQGAFEAGIEALRHRDVEKAIMARDNLVPRDGLKRHALTYAIVASGLPGISSEEYLAAPQTLSNWPGLKGLERHYERALYREHPSSDAIFAAFKDHAPETPEGNILLARALKSISENEKSTRIIQNLWATHPLNTWLEDEILKNFSGVLTKADHKTRMDYLLYRDRIKQAGRFAQMAGAKSLFDAWSAVIRHSRKAPALLKAAEKDFKDDPSLLYANIAYLQYKEDYEGAAKLLAQMPKDPSKRVNSDEWWHQQRIVSRGLFEEGKAKAAYDIAAAQVAQSTSAIADAEFQAGWIALTGLKDGKLAAFHFRKLLDVAHGPALTARALYWLGRADRQAGTSKGDTYFQRAAWYNHTFYGQIASTEVKSVPTREPAGAPTPSERQRFAAREPVKAIDLFEKVGFNAPARLLYRGLADSIQSPEELTILAEKAKRGEDEALALEIGKKAYAKGAYDPSLAFPVGVIPEEAALSGIQLALAYAISRQESGFNPRAVSSSNAKGLMQILPGTAKDMANQLGLAYAPDKLTEDTAYNTILGTQYLDNQIKRHGGSYVLTFAAYNAGPGKVKEWVERFGDPRGKSVEDVLNWIESIPYPETRTYVEHVMENFEAYRIQLGLGADIAGDLTAGG